VIKVKIYLDWQGRLRDEIFPATVPGNIQADYGRYKGFPDIHFGDNVRVYEQFEDNVWYYQTQFEKPEGNVFFVSHGIDYECNIYLNGEKILSHEGAFSVIEKELTEKLLPHNTLEVEILPHPTAGLDRNAGRDQAAHSAKAAVCYGWDWHPRMLTSGLWQDTYLEVRDGATVYGVTPSYTLNEDRTKAQVHFDIKGGNSPTVTLFDPDGKVCYSGIDPDFTVENVRLWWCSGQGEPSLYKYSVGEMTGYIGFKTVRLVMNEGAWKEPSKFPKSRSTPPITLELNGRKIFAKGSNWVRPELFPGTCSEDTYRPLVEAAHDAGMNIFRCWGGSEIFKESFYELCDRHGIMIWQEFPLACNCYPDDEHYLEILEQEARAIIKRVGAHACHILWCGGNELFNNWSGMTDQSHALRLLGALCFELDRQKPFIPTSPLMGMAHGPYFFETHGRDVFELFSDSDFTAYTEFGVPSLASPDYLKEFIPQSEYTFPIERGGSWELHHARGVFDGRGWLYIDTIEKYFGIVSSIEEAHEYSNIMQSEGYRAIFEEARRQWPHCSMAINWCYNEPWKVAAGNSLLNYPAIKKPCYYAVKEALRDTMPSARIKKFLWKEGEIFSAELWLLNDSPKKVCDSIRATVIAGGVEYPLITWENISAPANCNVRGHVVQFILGNYTDDFIYLRLDAECGQSLYKLRYQPKKKKIKMLNH